MCCWATGRCLGGKNTPPHLVHSRLAGRLFFRHRVNSLRDRIIYCTLAFSSCITALRYFPFFLSPFFSSSLHPLIYFFFAVLPAQFSSIQYINNTLDTYRPKVFTYTIQSLLLILIHCFHAKDRVVLWGFFFISLFPPKPRAKHRVLPCQLHHLL